MSKARTYWAGFVDGQVHESLVDEIYGRSSLWMPALYKTKRMASEFFEDVRRVRIVEVKGSKG